MHGAASSGHKEKYFKEHLITVQGALLLKMPASINICENVCMGKIPSYEKLRLCLTSGWGGGHGMGPELFASKWEAFGDGTVTALLGGSFVFCFLVLLFFLF